MILDNGSTTNQTKVGGKSCIDTFSGIGGFSAAAEFVGFDVVAHVEINPFCQAVLRKHWPDTPIIEDINDVNEQSLRGLGIERPYIITGGPPCQAASIAGQRQGAADRRWMWPAFLRVVRECQPVWVLAENPSGLLSLAAPGFDWICSQLEDAGYEVWATVFETGAHVGLPHARERVFIIGHMADAGSFPLHEPQDKALSRGTRGKARITAISSRANGLADTGNGQFQQSGRRPQGRNGAGPAGAAVVYAQSVGERPGQCAAEPRGKRRGRPCDTGRELEHSEHLRQPLERQHEPTGAQHAAAECAGGDGGTVANTDGTGPPRIVRARASGEGDPGAIIESNQGSVESSVGVATPRLPAGLDRPIPVAGVGPYQYPWEAPRVLPPRRSGQDKAPYLYRRERLAGAGNGVVLQAAIAVLRAIWEADGVNTRKGE